jgi:hypothetical protein
MPIPLRLWHGTSSEKISIIKMFLRPVEPAQCAEEDFQRLLSDHGVTRGMS